jgi:hypothetical protein
MKGTTKPEQTGVRAVETALSALEKVAFSGEPLGMTPKWETRLLSGTFQAAHRSPEKAHGNQSGSRKSVEISDRSNDRFR